MTVLISEFRKRHSLIYRNSSSILARHGRITTLERGVVPFRYIPVLNSTNLATFIKISYNSLTLIKGDSKSKRRWSDYTSISNSSWRNWTLSFCSRLISNTAIPSIRVELSYDWASARKSTWIIYRWKTVSLLEFIRLGIDLRSILLDFIRIYLLICLKV